MWTNQSPVYSVKFKSEWSYTSIPIRLHGMLRDGLILHFLDLKEFNIMLSYTLYKDEYVRKNVIS